MGRRLERGVNSSRFREDITRWVALNKAECWCRSGMTDTVDATMNSILSLGEGDEDDPFRYLHEPLDNSNVLLYDRPHVTKHFYLPTIRRFVEGLRSTSGNTIQVYNTISNLLDPYYDGGLFVGCPVKDDEVVALFGEVVDKAATLERYSFKPDCDDDFNRDKLLSWAEVSLIILIMACLLKRL